MVGRKDCAKLRIIAGRVYGQIPIGVMGKSGFTVRPFLFLAPKLGHDVLGSLPVLVLLYVGICLKTYRVLDVALLLAKGLVALVQGVCPACRQPMHGRWLVVDAQAGVQHQTALVEAGQGFPAF